ncbi:hypothetical protein [Georgenia sp. AZ-5]|uniref:hypothetical protein n=1 Tax=Georgenia sp. AZ-5 TaxID=3367526 RepID=UPI00375453C9
MTSATDTTRAPASAPELAHLDRLLARGVQVVRVVHSDLFGRQRAKQYPASALASILGGVAYSKMSVAEDLLGVPVSETDFPALASHPDLHAVVEPDTAVAPPWEPDAVWVLAGLYEHGERSPLCPRGALAAATRRLAELGLTAQAALEPEFYLFEPGGGNPRPYSVDGVSYTMDRGTDPAGVVGRIHRNLLDLGVGVTVVTREFSPGQFEVNLHHAEATAAADQAFLMKTAVKELAVIEGLRANFMAKPMTGHEGSSLHAHVSLWDADERNVLVAPDGRSLSPTALAAIAGVQAHAPALMALAAPTVNSYKRLRGEGLSPRSTSWAEDNRRAFVRVPAERGTSTRFEVRAGDASASPHLLLAGILHAARDGIVRGVEPSPGGAALPASLPAALDALAADDVLVDGLGAELVDVYGALKRAEVAAFEAAVTDWEWNLYSVHA